MQKPKRFIAIAAERYNDKLVMLSASTGARAYDESGIKPLAGLDFLFDLIHERNSKTTAVFVCYGFAVNYEFLFSECPSAIKDKLFKSEPIKKRLNEIELENEGLDEILYSREDTGFDWNEADFNKEINRTILANLKDIAYGSYHLELVNGKFLKIKRDGKSITIWDVAGFFGKPTRSLRTVIKEWLKKDLVHLDTLEREKLELPLTEKFALSQILATTGLATLMASLQTNLRTNGISVSRWHGATVLSSYWLSKLQAKTEFHNYRYRRQLSPELYKAVRQSNYGGRSEQFKIGTVKDVYIYDINSAYAYAASFLPVMLQKPSYCTDYQPGAPFSIWYVNYDLRDLNLHYGLLPHRDVTNFTKYPLKGSGYYWQPEVDFMIRHYPEHIKIGSGFVLGYEQADFAKGIETIYQLRLELQRRGDPLEKVFKLALAGIYGKFCQHNGRGYYYNLFYAGFITSLVRMMLLEATKGYEQETICFQTDAIHSTCSALPVHCDNTLGAYKQQSFNAISYIDNGVYLATNNKTARLKTRGFRSIDFDKAISELQHTQAYTALTDFFITHNLHTSQMFTGAKYLNRFEQSKTNSPLARNSAMRLFETLDIDLTESYLSSKPISSYSGRESSVYRPTEFSGVDLGVEVI